jgi:hypothetical protein
MRMRMQLQNSLFEILSHDMDYCHQLAASNLVIGC